MPSRRSVTSSVPALPKWATRAWRRCGKMQLMYSTVRRTTLRLATRDALCGLPATGLRLPVVAAMAHRPREPWHRLQYRSPGREVVLHVRWHSFSIAVFLHGFCTSWAVRGMRRPFCTSTARLQHTPPPEAVRCGSQLPRFVITYPSCVRYFSFVNVSCGLYCVTPSPFFRASSRLHSAAEPRLCSPSEGNPSS